MRDGKKYTAVSPVQDCLIILRKAGKLFVGELRLNLVFQISNYGGKEAAYEKGSSSITLGERFIENK